MGNTEFVIYKKEKYYIQTSGRYYAKGHLAKSDKIRTRLLHRRIWIEYNGPIPKGFHIHHIDGNWRNNCIENLEAVCGRKHQSSHMLSRFADKDYKENIIKVLNDARNLANEWHGSGEGLKWHKLHGKKTWENRKTKESICNVCGKIYKTYFPSRSKFCSKSCEQKQRYKNKTKTIICQLCGTEKKVYKYGQRQFCSYKCSAKARLRNKSV